ncbi:unnamed protein product [Vicia faba]|uniref:START domain-containing protein n=1 Tax=Vicia faba TaxID=3906 RepID=A0AAV1AKN5_VICFA|nr:unnamed protein product [Vicia faba]
MRTLRSFDGFPLNLSNFYGGCAILLLLVVVVTLLFLLNRKSRSLLASSLISDSSNLNPRVYNCRTSNTVTDADLKFLMDEILNQNHKWEDVIDKTNHHLCYKAKSTKPKNGPLKYWSMTVFNDISAEMLRNFYMDNHYRKQWDNTVVEHNQLQLDESDGSEVGRTEGGDENIEAEEAVIGFWSGFAWLAGMTVFTALLSEYVVDTIEDASDSWGLSVSFLSIILLPVVGNAAEHAGAIIFAFKNKLDISLGVALGSATQIAMFVVPLCVTVACGMGVNMDLNFNLIETGSLAVAIIVTSFTLQKKLQAAIKDSVSENEAFQKVFGKEKHGYVRSMGLGVTPSQINRSTRSTSSSAESEQIKEMQEEINALKEKNSKIDELTQAIIFLTQRDKARTKENELLMQMQNFSGRQGLESPADGRRSSESSYHIGDNGTSGGTN